MARALVLDRFRLEITAEHNGAFFVADASGGARAVEHPRWLGGRHLDLWVGKNMGEWNLVGFYWSNCHN